MKENLTLERDFELEVEFTSNPACKVPYWEEATTHLTLIQIQQMLPRSDEQFVGNEYFMG